MGRFTNPFCRCAKTIVFAIQVAHDIFDHHDGAIDNHAKIQRTKRQQVWRNVAQIQTNRSKEQREGNCQRNNQCSARIAQKEKEDNHHQDDSLSQIVQDRMRCVADQVRAIQERYNFHPRR